MQTHDVTGGLEPAIIRLVLDNPDMGSSAIMRALRAINIPETTRENVRFVRRIIRQVIVEQERRKHA